MLSIVVSTLLSPAFAGAITKSLLASNRGLANSFGSFSAIAEPLVGIFVSIIIFVPVFLLTRAIVAMIIKRVYREKIQKLEDELDDEDHEDTWLKRNGRAVSITVGCLSAVVITMTVSSPLLGIVHTADDVVDFAESSSFAMFNSENLKDVKKGVEKYSNDVSGKIFYSMGGKLVYRSYACTFYEGERIGLVREIKLMKSAVTNITNVLPVLSGNASLTDEHIKSIDEVCNCVTKMKLGRKLLAQYIPSAARTWLDGGEMFGISKPRLNFLIEPTFNEMLRVCANSEEYNVQQNTVTLLQVYKIFLETRIMDLSDSAAFNDVLAFIENTGIVGKLTDELSQNPFMLNVKKQVDDIMVDVVADQINMIEFGDEAYLNLMGNIADSINLVNSKGYKTEEEKRAVLTGLTKQYIKEYGLDVSDTAAEYTADVILENFGSSSGAVDAAAIQEFFNSYN